jgi:hypothetical protein
MIALNFGDPVVLSEQNFEEWLRNLFSDERQYVLEQSNIHQQRLVYCFLHVKLTDAN